MSLTHSTIQSIQKAVSLAAQSWSLDDCELFIKRQSTLQIDSKDQQIDTFLNATDLGISIRLMKDQKVGFSYTYSDQPQSLQKALQTAYDMLEIMPPQRHLPSLTPPPAIYPPLLNHDSEGLQAPLEEKIHLAQSLERYCLQTDPRIRSVRSASFSQTESEIHLLNLKGLHLSHQSTSYSASVLCKAEDSKDSQVGWDSGYSYRLDQLPLSGVAEGAAQDALERLGAAQASNYQGPVILRNQVVAELLEFLATSFSREEIDKNKSYFKNKIGEKLFPASFHLVQDGQSQQGIHSAPFDAEGTPTQLTPLIERGVFQTPLYDRSYAHQHHCQPTGSAIRGIKLSPKIGCHNLWLKPGTHSLEQLYQELSQGILITELMGLHTGNPITGQFSVGASGIHIQGGQRGRPIRGFAIAGNVFQLFQNILCLGKDLKFFGTTAAPSLLLGQLTVSGLS